MTLGAKTSLSNPSPDPPAKDTGAGSHSVTRTRRKSEGAADGKERFAV